MLHVLLDAEPFSQENLEFNSRRFDQLIDLVESGRVRLYITDVVRGEGLKKIGERVKEVVHLLRENRRNLRILMQIDGLDVSGLGGQLDEAALADALKGKFGRLLERARIEVIPSEGVSVAELCRRYFEGVPPFSTKEAKKYEFPDALTVIAAERYARDNNLTMHIVSADKDLIASAEQSRHLGSMTKLVEVTNYVLTRDEMARTAELAFEALRGALTGTVQEIFLASGFYVEDEWESDVEHVEARHIDLGEPDVGEINGEVVTLELLATVDFAADAVIADPEMTHRDKEEGQTLVFGWLRETIEASREIDVSIVISVDLASPENSQILDVSVGPDNFGLDWPWHE